MSGSLGLGKSTRKGGVNTKKSKDLIQFSQGTLAGGGPGSFGDILFELNRLRGTENEAFSAANAQFDQVGAGLDAFDAQNDPSAALMQSQALTSTDKAASAGALLSREAAGGRGGSAFGSGAGEVARRSASDVADAQGGALIQGLLGAQQISDQRRLASIQSRTQLGQMRQDQAGFLEDNRERGLTARKQFLELMAQIAGAGTSGIGGAIQSRGRSVSGSISGSRFPQEG